MRADRVDVSWNAEKSNWLVRIQAGEEVIRRHCDLTRNTDEQAIRTAALKTVQDEGYEVDPSNLTIQKLQVA